MSVKPFKHSDQTDKLRTDQAKTTKINKYKLLYPKTKKLNISSALRNRID